MDVCCTTGIFVRGDIVKGLIYQGMLGNNLSQLGVDAGQLGNAVSPCITGAVTRTGRVSRAPRRSKNSQIRISDGNIVFKVISW